jgi:spoIIIJ-associated protein
MKPNSASNSTNSDSTNQSTRTSSSKIKTIKKITQDLVSRLDLNPEITLETDRQNQSETLFINLAVPEENSGLIIGHHGETIDSLQLILALMVYQKLKTWKHLVLNVNDYRQRRQQTLKIMAQNAVDRVRTTHEEAMMPYLSSHERRFIHLLLAEEEDIRTESIGTGRDRRLVISLKQKTSLES